MPRPITLFTGQWADLPFEEVARLASRVGLRRPRDRLLGRPPRPVAGRRGRRLHPGQARPAGEVRPQGLRDLQPPQGPGGLRRPDRRAAPGDPVRAGLGRRRPRGRAPARGRGDEADRAHRPAARREDGGRLHRLLDLEVRRDVPAGLRRRWSPPATRTSPTAGTRSSTSSTSAASGSRTRCTPREIAYDYWTTVAHDGGDRPPRGVRPQLGPEPLRLAGPRPGRLPLGLQGPDLPRRLQGHEAARSATAATAGSARTCRGPTRGAAGTSSPPATATCRGSSASGCSTPSATTARSRWSGRTPAWTACVGAPEALEFVRRLAFDAPEAAFDAAFATDS